jgi:PAS domain S-box-containing protein
VSTVLTFSYDDHTFVGPYSFWPRFGEYMAFTEDANWRHIADHLPSMVAYWDENLICRTANRAYETWFGVSPDQLVGRTLASLLGERLFSLNKPYIDGALAGTRQRFERLIPGPNGTTRHSIAQYIPDIRDGHVYGFVAYVVDVTHLMDTQSELQATIESLRAEIARREVAEARVQTIENVLAETLQSLGTGFIATDSEGTISQINQIAANLFEYSGDEAVGRPFMEVYRREDRPPEHQTINPVDEIALRPVAVDSAHYVMALSKSGRRIPMELRVGLMKNPDGKPSGLFALVKEQSALHDAERRLEFMEFRLEAIVDASPNALFISDDEGNLRFVNKTAERLTGYSRGELIGMTIDDLVHSARRTAHQTHRQRYQNNRTSRAMGTDMLNLSLLRRDGELIPVEVGLSPVPSDSTTFTLATVTDITERTVSQDALRRSNESLEQFAYVASHDLQAPLRIVASFAQLLDRRYRGQLDPKADSYLDHIVNGARQMQTLVDDLLHFSRVGDLVALGPVDTQSVWTELCKTRKAELDEQQALVVTGPLPKVQSTEALVGDILQNLLTNALKFRSAAPLTVEVRARTIGKMAEFSFKDNGIGIAPEYHTKIFQMFQRLHPRGQYEGSGIGLTVVRRIIESHGGRIWLTSALGEGTTFYFTLPLSE